MKNRAKVKARNKRQNARAVAQNKRNLKKRARLTFNRKVNNILKTMRVCGYAEDRKNRAVPEIASEVVPVQEVVEEQPNQEM